MSDPRVSKARVEFSADTTKLDAALNGVQAKLGKLNAITGTSFGLLGVGLSVDALVQLGGQAIQAGNALTAMQATLRAVAGSQEQYDRIVQVATANQALFGGALADNLVTMQQFAFIANRTGADLSDLNDVAQLLALVNPFEGFEGAGFALGELFAGDITSIVERFNLSREAVRGLINESDSAAEIIAGLTALLAEQGITSEVLAAKTNTVAQEYQTFGTNVSNAFTAMGQGLAEAGEPLVGFVNDLVQALTDLSPVVSAYVAGLEGVDPATIAIGLNSEIAANSVNNLNQVALEGADTYDAYASAFDNSVARLNSGASLVAAEAQRLTEAQFVYAQSLLLTGASTEQAISLASQFGKELSATSEFTTEMTERSTALEEAQMLLAQAQARAAIAASEQAAQQAASMGVIDTSTLATKALETALGDATKAMFEAANANLSLDQQAQQAAIALLGAGEAGRLAALQLAGSTSDIDKLIARYYNLAVAAQSARNASVVSGMELGLIGPSAPVVAPRTVVPTGGGGGGGATSAARDQADELQRIAERHQERMLRAEETYQERLLRITEDYAKRRRKANQDYSDQQFEDRAGFYRQLMNIEDEAIRQQASAEYEALALEATQIRDALGADVAAEYLAEAGRVAAARAQRADEIRKARQDGDKNLEYLIALDKMEREVEDRRLKRAGSGEASIASQEEEDKQEAAVQLQEDIKNAADDAGKALLKAQQDANTAVGVTNEALQKQVDLLGQIGGKPTTTTAGTATTTTTATTDAAPLATGAAVGTTGIAVYDAVVAQALAGVRDAVNAVERAVSRIPTRSAVGGG
jgi:hypothetical protein